MQYSLAGYYTRGSSVQGWTSNKGRESSVRYFPPSWMHAQVDVEGVCRLIRPIQERRRLCTGLKMDIIFVHM
ncbi:hypothetical protein LIER_00779 [Lithospermum erythrorhizon]|uniref:Uncharacterized protein n=1 Tax=Lithospermum erythrorhizon TaxID=34254 RepID=A0AAV3NII4_LITER